jgi:hypothetical protein
MLNAYCFFENGKQRHTLFVSLDGILEKQVRGNVVRKGTRGRK